MKSVPLVLVASTVTALSVALEQSAPQKAAPASIVATATVSARWTSDLHAKVAGFVSEVLADLGDPVKRGQRLAVIVAPELEQERRTAEATLAARKEMVGAADAAADQAQAALEVASRQVVALDADRELADATLRRQEELFATKAATEQQLDEVRTRASVARANADVARAKVDSGKADVAAARANASVARAQSEVAAGEVERLRALCAYLEIVAPFDGVVTWRGVNPGDLVAAAPGGGGAPLFTCQQLDTVRVVCDVPEESAALVRVGDPVELKIFGLGGRVVPGAVTRVAGSIDARSRKMRVEVDLQNPDGSLRAGMYAEARIAPRSSG